MILSIISKMAAGTHLMHLNPHPASAHKNITGLTENKIISYQLSLFIQLFQFCSFLPGCSFYMEEGQSEINLITSPKPNITRLIYQKSLIFLKSIALVFKD